MNDIIKEKIRRMAGDRLSISAMSRELKIGRRTIAKTIKKNNMSSYNPWTKEYVKYLSPVQEEILRGTILGDDCLYIFKGCRYPKLLCYHSSSQEKYINFKFSVWKNLISYDQPKRHHRKTGGIRLSFATCNNECFIDIYKKIYINSNTKRITREYLDQLTPISIAFWFQDDGSRCKNRGLALHTNCFSLIEVEIICKWFLEKYGILCHPQQRKENQWVVFFSNKTSEKFAEMIIPYVIPELRYKLAGIYIKNPQRLYAVPFILKTEDIV